MANATDRSRKGPKRVAWGQPDHDALRRPGAKRSLPPNYETPYWHGWDWTNENTRIIKFIEEVLVQPIGVGQGQPFRVAGFQRSLLKRAVDNLATFISISTGNGKTTLMAAVALERITRGDDYVEVDILATKEEQARRLVEAAIRMVECCPELIPLCDVLNSDAILVYKPTGSKMTSHPAKLSAVQGLNFNLALIDEISEVPPELVTTMIARLGKRPNQRIIGFGTPGFGPDNMLETLRKMYLAHELPPGVEFIEYSAEPGCDIYDRAQWMKANPAIKAGFLDPASLPLKAMTMPEHEFRAYHLGQPVDSSGVWLPFGAWDECFQADAPGDGQPVVLAVWGNYRRQVSIAGATLDGSVFFGWEGEKPADEELEAVLRQACEQWDVVELVHKPHIRLNLMARLLEDDIPVAPWPTDRTTDADSTAALYQAIAEHTIAHDHHLELSEQVGRLVAQVDRQGNPRLVDSDADVSAALAMRAAWWRARAIAEEGVMTDEVMIY